MGRGALSQSGQCLLSYSLISLIRAEPPEGERGRARPRGGPARGDRRGTGGGGRFGAIGPKCLRIRMFRYCSLASLVPAMSRPCRSSWEGGWSPTARMLGNIRVIGLSRLYRSRKSFKASRLSRCGTGVPMFHRGKDFRVLKYWGTELRTAETLVCTRCPCPKILGHGIAVAGILPASCLRWDDYQVTDVPFQRDYQHNRGHSAAGAVAEGPSHFNHTKARPSTEIHPNLSRLSMQSMAPTHRTLGPHQEIIGKRQLAFGGSALGIWALLVRINMRMLLIPSLISSVRAATSAGVIRLPSLSLRYLVAFSPDATRSSASSHACTISWTVFINRNIST